MPRGKKVLDLLFATFLSVCLAACLAPFVSIVISTLVHGVNAIARVGLFRFLTAPPPAPGAGAGGIGPALAGSVVMTCLTTLIGVPVSIAVAVLVTEFPRSRFAQVVRALCKALMEVPTILLSMAIYVLVVIPMGSASALAGAVALSLIMIPYTTTYIENQLEAVPLRYREAGYAIGLTKAGVALRISAGIAARGVAVGIVMGIARALGETAPLLFTAGGSHYAYPTSLTSPVDSLTLLVYDFATSPYSNLIGIAWGAALVLTLIYLAIFFVVRILVKEVRA